LAQGIGDAEHRGAPQFPRTGGPAHQHGECPGRTAHFADRGQALVRDSLRRIARGVLSVHRSPVHLRPAGVTVRRLAFVLTGIALLAGCGAPEGSPIATATVTDSAGIRIVTSTAPAWAEGRGWTVDTVPELVIGDERTLPSVLLVGVTAARRLERDGYLVTTSDDALIRWFDRDGAEQRRAGGSGTGSGEFRDLELPGVKGDTLILWDTRLERITRMTLDGTTIGTSQLRVPENAQVPDPTVTGVFGDGRLLLSGRARALSTMPSALRRDTIPLAIASVDGTFERLIARVPGHENVIVTGPGFVTMLQRPFGARTLVATDDNTL